VKALNPNGHRLSPRLRQTLVCVLQGDSEKQVAARLGLSLSTTHQYITALYRIFGVRSRSELLAHVLRQLAPELWAQLLNSFVCQDSQVGALLDARDLSDPLLPS
jgi:DNA-binding CsgD family transcriptional regulator